MTAMALPTRRATLRLAKRLAAALSSGDLVLFEGELGAGKTFLCRGVVRALGVTRDVTVASPTFSLVHEYDTPRFRVMHADLYRLERPADVRELGLREARSEGAVVLAEWAARFADELGDDGLLVTLTTDPRTATLSPRGPRGDALLKAASLWPRLRRRRRR